MQARHGRDRDGMPYFVVGQMARMRRIFEACAGGPKGVAGAMAPPARPGT